MIADELLKVVNPYHRDMIPKVVQGSIVMKINNVSDYYYSNPKDVYVFGDFNNVAPPWQSIWFEWRTSGTWLTDSLLHVKGTGARYEEVEKGVWKVYSGIGPTAYGSHFYYLSAGGTGFDTLGARWILLGSIFNVHIGHIVTQLFLIQPDGSFLILPGDHKEAAEYLHQLTGLNNVNSAGKFFLPKLATDEMLDRYHRTGMMPDCSSFDVPFLALSFCHCRNVKTVKTAIDEPIIKKRRKNGAVDVTKYYTILIEPMKKVLRTEGRDREVGIAQAFKICRGHFKHYEEGKGLFGKLHGTYFWADRLKGMKPEYEIKL